MTGPAICPSRVFCCHITLSNADEVHGARRAYFAKGFAAAQLWVRIGLRGGEEVDAVVARPVIRAAFVARAYQPLPASTKSAWTPGPGGCRRRLAKRPTGAGGSKRRGKIANGNCGERNPERLGGRRLSDVTRVDSAWENTPAPLAGAAENAEERSREVLVCRVCR
jgi:hypothetical protein